jgi:histidinol-phosphate aminotransferase
LRIPSLARNNLKLQLPENISTLAQYPIDKSQEELKRESGIDTSITLASNENPWGPSPKVTKALALALATVHRYPDGAGYSLVQGLSRKIGVSSSEIVLGNGSSEIVELLIRVFVNRGSEVISSYPSSMMYQRCVQIHSGKNIIVPLKRLTHDLTQIMGHITDDTRIIILDNPNNPTGTALNPGDLYSFLSEIPESVVVVLDEGYVEFMDKEKQLDIFSLIRNTRNRCGIVTVRTFSRAYGLAGLRIGFGVMPGDIATFLQKVRQPFNVNRLAQTAALAALEDEEYLDQTLERTKKGREYLREEVKKLGCTSYPSQTNFVLIDVKMDAARLYHALLGKGLIVHPMTLFGLPDCIRISIGTDEENKRFITVLAECLLDLEDA